MSYAHAYSLHRSVRADRWSVTKQDFKDFLKAVSCAVLDGEILPSRMDDFDPADRVRGPNMYTVTEQFIKPKTASAGGMSWALMVHPNGLQCDLFVSHAWQEGIFELISNLFNGWLWNLKHAWCCALANPQNLDISALISNPAESPFAVALTSASHIVVVSNSETGIYSRLWCCYEAFLGYQHGKTIMVGHAPISKDVCRSIPILALAYVLAFALAVFSATLFDEDRSEYKSIMGLVVLEFVCAVCTYCENTLVWRVCNVIGVALNGFISGFAISLPRPFPLARMKIRSWNRPEYPAQTIGLLSNALVTVCWLVSETDRIRFAALDTVKEDLQRGYSGSVLHAQCTNHNDKTNILAAIGGHAEDVDQAVSLLISSGMYSDSLGNAAVRGLRVKGASRFRVMPLVFWFGRLGVKLLAAAVFCRTWDLQRCFDLTLLVLILMWLLVLANLRIDRKAFMVAASNKAALLWAMDYAFDSGVAAFGFPTWWSAFNIVEDMFWTMMLLALISVACIGIDGLAALGFFGRWLVRFITATKNKQLATLWKSLIHYSQGGREVQETCDEDQSQHASSPDNSDSSSSDSEASEEVILL